MERIEALAIVPTPRPWILQGVGAYWEGAKDRGNLFNCILRTGTHIPLHQNEINAEFIVRAVNSHEALLDVARKYHVLSHGTNCGACEDLTIIAQAEGE